jgi:hypothetical protein
MDRALIGAEAIGVFLTGAADQARVLSGPQRNAAVMGHALLDNCAGAGFQFMDALDDVALAAFPYLASRDGAVLLERVRASKCYGSLNDTQRREIAWLQAVNDRDAKAIYTTGEFLVRNAPASEPRYPDYLISAMAAAIATGRVAEARALRDHYVPALPARSRDRIAMSLVLAHLAQPSGPVPGK